MEYEEKILVNGKEYDVKIIKTEVIKGIIEIDGMTHMIRGRDINEVLNGARTIIKVFEKR